MRGWLENDGIDALEELDALDNGVDNIEIY